MTAKKAKKPKRPDIVHAMVGTAGHVSHGKSTLVQILTGCVVNRLPEEQQRGLTINLGFAACFLPGDRVIGIVDVPGHRDFIRNMVAGAVSIDILMLIVADRLADLHIHSAQGVYGSATSVADTIDYPHEDVDPARYYECTPAPEGTASV